MSHKPPPCGHCTHRNYSLSCDEFDEFVAEHGNRCAICGRTGAETGHGFLVIDHDFRLGYWAVRGLLCSRCNTPLDFIDRVRTPEEDAYLADSWWRRSFAARGWPVDLPPEPDPGAVVLAGQLRWAPGKRGWECSWERKRPMDTWQDLVRHYGPHRIQVMSR